MLPRPTVRVGISLSFFFVVILAFPAYAAKDSALVKLATEYNDSAAQYILARRYLLGKTGEKDVSQATKWFKLAAKNGHSKAQFELGKLYLQGQGVKKDKLKALDWFGKAAKQKNSNALYELGNMFFNGLDTKPDYKRAAKWYQLAAKLNHGKAQYRLGIMYNLGKGVSANKEKSDYWLGLAKEQGVKLSKSASQTSHQNEIRTTNNDTQLPDSNIDRDSSEPSEKGDDSSANMRRAESQYNLGARLLKSARGKSDIKKALSLFYKAADRGYAQAYYQLGMAYKEGNGVVKSYSEAQKWFEKAQQSGISKATYALNSMDKNHQSNSVASLQKRSNKQDPLVGLPVNLIDNEPTQTKTPEEIAFNNIRTMAQRNDPKAQFQLAASYEKGNVVDKDGQQALHWYTLSGQKGYLESQLELGKIYMFGRGVPKDLESAQRWLTLAASRNSKEAQSLLDSIKSTQQKPASTSKISESKPVDKEMAISEEVLKEKGDFTLAMNYLEGKDSAKNTEKAIKLLSKAAQNNHPQALLALGKIFYQGRDVEQDYGKAAEWYKKAATAGNAEAQFKLGYMYKKGLGVDKNNSLALKWYHKAARQGHSEAKEKLGGCSYC